MKRIVQRALSLFLLAAVMLILLTSCGGSSDGLAPTDKLVVYCPPTMNVEINQVKAEFERRYPDINLEYIEFGTYLDEEARTSFSERLKVELLAGRGPDVVFFDRRTFPDLYKVLDAGVFYDLNEMLDTDETFHIEDYIRPIFDGGLYQGKRQFIPLTFRINYLLADSAALRAQGIEISEQPNFSKWSQEMSQYIATHTEAQIQQALMEWFRTFQTLFAHSGLQVLHYETKQINVETEDLRLFVETFKQLYPYPNNEIWDGLFALRGKYGPDGGYWTAIQEQKQLYETYCYAFDLETWLNAEYGVPKPDKLFAFPTFEGHQAMAVGENFVAINAASVNKQNAYLFLKTALWTGAQSSLEDNVVSKAGLPSLSMVKALEGEAVEGYETVLPLEYYRNYSNTLMDIVYARMEPYFRDEKSYEDCLAELQSALELYINE